MNNKISYEDFADQFMDKYGYNVELTITNEQDGSVIYSSSNASIDSMFEDSVKAEKAIEADLWDMYHAEVDYE